MVKKCGSFECNKSESWFSSKLYRALFAVKIAGSRVVVIYAPYNKPKLWTFSVVALYPAWSYMKWRLLRYTTPGSDFVKSVYLGFTTQPKCAPCKDADVRRPRMHRMKSICRIVYSQTLHLGKRKNAHACNRTSDWTSTVVVCIYHGNSQCCFLLEKLAKNVFVWNTKRNNLLVYFDHNIKPESNLRKTLKEWLSLIIARFPVVYYDHFTPDHDKLNKTLARSGSFDSEFFLHLWMWNFDSHWLLNEVWIFYVKNCYLLWNQLKFVWRCIKCALRVAWI